MTPVPNELPLRPGRIADIPALLALEEASFTTDRLDARAFRRFLRGDTAVLVVAPADRPAAGDDAIAGYALVTFRRNCGLGRLYSIAVDARFRGRGLGERLLAAAEQATRARGCRALRLEVRPDNAAAISLYDRRGYRPIGTYASFYEDGTDALRFETSVG